MSAYQVLLYYKFIPIDNPETLAEEQRIFCMKGNLRGRIIVAPEGLNGTLSGTMESASEYIGFMKKDPRFSDIDFKIDASDGHAFRKLFVRVRPEIVTLGRPDIRPHTSTGRRLNPDEFRSFMRRDDVVVLDIRNDYEYAAGHFKNSIRPDVRSFKEFPAWIEQNVDGNKKILTYCTGGIRCEKLTSYLMREGFSDVYQLNGGIVRYSQDSKTRGQDFDGRCYVFDERITIPVNFINPSVVSECCHCGTPSERYLNCAHLDCHQRFFCCESCERLWRRSCSETCRSADHHEWVPV